MNETHTAILGCGNQNRSDDGAGPAVINILKKYKIPDGVLVRDAGTDGMGVMYQARGVSKLIIIDAKAPENTPGAIYKVPGEVLAAPPRASLNLHDFRWDHAIYAGHQIYQDDFPHDVTVFLIEASCLDMGLELSPEIQKSAQQVADEILQMIRAY